MMEQAVGLRISRHLHPHPGDSRRAMMEQAFGLRISRHLHPHPRDSRRAMMEQAFGLRIPLHLYPMGLEYHNHIKFAVYVTIPPHTESVTYHSPGCNPEFKINPTRYPPPP